MGRFTIKIFILFIMLLGLPMLGILLAGYPISRYLEFPPQTRYITPAPFSWTAFVIYAIFILCVILPLAVRGSRTGVFKQAEAAPPCYPFPWWGWTGIAFGCVSWILAWTRFNWFSVLQPHTFIPLWLSYILVVNAATFRKTGACMLLSRPVFFLLLFPASAVFWWFFEYLNRFVQNWHYVGVHYSPWKYFGYATLSFSTVLPAVLSTSDWFLSSRRLKKSFMCFHPVTCSHPNRLAWIVLSICAAGLAGIGVSPNFLFSLLWVSPLLIIVSLQTLMNEPHVFSNIRDGDWTLLVSAAFAALFCGGFWEMWNYHSLARWEYSIPFVHRFNVFEMPILGYAGYLPFGLMCVVIGKLLEEFERNFLVLT